MDFFWVYTTFSVIVCLFAIPRALGGNVSFTKVPWIRSLRETDCFGGNGKRQIFIGLGWLTLWCFVSVVTASCLLYFYLGAISVFSEENQQESIRLVISCSILALATYLYFTSKASQLIRESKDNAPSAIILGEAGSDLNLSDQGQLSSFIKLSRLKGKNRSEAVFRGIYYIVPIILKGPLSYFYMQSGVIIQGCTRILMKDYGEDTIRSFLPYHLKISPNEDLELVSSRFSKADRDSQEYLYAMLGAKVAQKGFPATEQYIITYLMSRSVGDKKARYSKRSMLLKSVKVEFICDGKMAHGKVVELSDDRKGCYLNAKYPFSENDDIQVSVKNKKTFMRSRAKKTFFRGKIVHTNALRRGAKINCGAGICFPEEFAIPK